MDRSDVPGHEGPTHHAIVDLWKYQFPLSKENKEKLISQLQVVAPLNEQAKINLTGNAKDLWIAGIRDIKTQSQDLKSILAQPGVNDQPDLVAVINEAIESTDNFVTWLEKESASKRALRELERKITPGIRKTCISYLSPGMMKYCC